MMIIENNLPTSGAIQVPQCVLKIFCNLLDRYSVSSSKPIEKDDATSVSSLIKTIVQSNTINPIQAKTLREHAEFCIGFDLAIQHFDLDLSVVLNDEDSCYITNWIMVKNFIQKTFKKDL